MTVSTILLMRIRDDITPHSSSCSAASTKREREREREREIKCERERKKPQPTEREREIVIFSMMGIVSAFSSFSALLPK